MYDPDNNCTHTAHTTNPVPLMIVSNNAYAINPDGGLANVAPTIFELLNIQKPKEMIDSLIR
ncbi:MAG: hypothetical protein A3H59_01300 [Candidatus Jacksonbacteria bacterium RIFCSPLOWO2_02_FULL_43_9]|nr:MAG: hypothetical protein A3H59_01300 [Candidatus Jacksonbacteria bacterium RIFCSPLOWO2_02_FULL_43_9]HAZ17118.1 hypothetical protein [Candidatus Jacksonbacteria bacterium]